MSAKLKQHIAGLAILAATVVVSIGLHEIGSANAPHDIAVQFTRGATLDPGAGAAINRTVSLMAQNPNFHAIIEGHTGTLGDTDANLVLAEKRAETIAQRLIDAGLPASRITTVGLGGAEPLPRKDGEARRSYQNRLSRGEIHLRAKGPKW